MHSPYIFTLNCERQSAAAAYTSWAAKFIVESNRVKSAYRTYCNYAWQSGDFPHFYAAIISSLMAGEDNVTLIISCEQTVPQDVISDIWFALGGFCRESRKHVVVIVFEHMGRNVATDWKNVVGVAEVFGPMEATEHASALVKSMKAGETFSAAWSGLIRGGHDGLFKAYGKACRAFADKFFGPQYGFKREDFQGTSRFICVWDRNVGLSGANPQYNSTLEGNFQLCQVLSTIPDVRAVLLVGTGFCDATRGLPKVFDMGGFWSKLNGIKGRMEQNGFFHYMTSMYDCDVVHVGMKSGGMDALGLLGQKVVFIDTKYAPDITKQRVEHFNASHISPIEVAALPSSAGKVLDYLRQSPKPGVTPITTTIPNSRLQEVKDLAARMTATIPYYANRFSEDDLARIADRVRLMFSA